MHIGITIFPTDKGIQPVEVAREAEARGFDSLWFPEHSHIPASRRTPWGGRVNAPDLPEEYWRTHDPFTALAAAAAVTTTLKIGTGICLVAQRDAVYLAKEVASLDLLSNGRFQFGIGYGWNHEEMETHGVDIARRRKVVREKVLACKELWTKDEAEFHGEYVNFEPCWSWPKPVQKPHPPIVVGASPTELHFRHIIEYGDVWMPIEGRWPIADKWHELCDIASEAGRDPPPCRSVSSPPPPLSSESPSYGTSEQRMSHSCCHPSTETLPWPRSTPMRRSSPSSTCTSAGMRFLVRRPTTPTKTSPHKMPGYRYLRPQPGSPPSTHRESIWYASKRPIELAISLTTACLAASLPSTEAAANSVGVHQGERTV